MPDGSSPSSKRDSDLVGPSGDRPAIFQPAESLNDLVDGMHAADVETDRPGGRGPNEPERKSGFQPILGEIDRSRTPELRELLSIRDRAYEAAKSQYDTKLLEPRITDQLENGLLPGIRTLDVPPNSEMFLFSELHPPIRLEEGRHEVSQIGFGSGLKNSFRAYSERLRSRHGNSRMLICTATKKRFFCTFTLPDYAEYLAAGEPQWNQIKKPRLESDEELQQRLQRVFESARTTSTDGVCVGVRMQLELQLERPETLTASFYRKLTRNRAKEIERLGDDQDDPGLLSQIKFPLAVLHQLLLNTPRDMKTALKPISMFDVQRLLRYEVGDALRDAVRDYSSKQLIEEQARIRGRFVSYIKDHVSDSLQRYGIKVIRAVSVDCVSPVYTKGITRRGDASLRETELETKRKVQEIERDELEIETERFENQVRSQNVRSRIATDEQAKTERNQFEQQRAINQARDETLLEGQRAQLQREAERGDHERIRRLKDAQTDQQIEMSTEQMRLQLDGERLRLQQEKQQAAVRLGMQYDEHRAKLTEDAANAEHRRQIERLDAEFNREMQANEAQMKQRLGFLEQFASLTIDRNVPESKALVMALATNPELAQTYVAAKRADGKDEQIASMQAFQEKLSDVHGGQNELVNRLMNEGIRQIGGVLKAHLGERKQQRSYRVVDPRIEERSGNPDEDFGD